MAKASEGKFKTPGALLLKAHLARLQLSIPRFCEAHAIDRIKVQKAVNGDLQRVDVEFAFDIERLTGGDVPAVSWCAPEHVRAERRRKRSEAAIARNRDDCAS